MSKHEQNYSLCPKSLLHVCAPKMCGFEGAHCGGRALSYLVTIYSSSESSWAQDLRKDDLPPSPVLSSPPPPLLPF